MDCELSELETCSGVLQNDQPHLHSLWCSFCTDGSIVLQNDQPHLHSLRYSFCTNDSIVLQNDQPHLVYGVVSVQMTVLLCSSYANGRGGPRPTPPLVHVITSDLLE